MIITTARWDKYIKVLRQINDKAAAEMVAKVADIRQRVLANELTEDAGVKALIDYGFALATKYGEASAAVACEMYDALAELSGGSAPAAMPAATATYRETADAVRGALAFSRNESVMGAAVGRLVKMASADTMQQNALRDGAEWAWIPRGETCAYCIALASNGWQKASKGMLKDGHARHIHANCDCMFAIRLTPDIDVQGYRPDEYRRMYQDAPLDKWNTDSKGPASAEIPTSKNRINAMRREAYAENRERINEQKRSAYAKRRELESSAAEEINVD